MTNKLSANANERSTIRAAVCQWIVISWRATVTVISSGFSQFVLFGWISGQFNMTETHAPSS